MVDISHGKVRKGKGCHGSWNLKKKIIIMKGNFEDVSYYSKFLPIWKN